MTEINSTAQIVPINEKAKDYLNRLTIEQRMSLKNQLGDQAFFCMGYTIGESFDYVSFFNNDSPSEEDFVYAPDIDFPVRYRQQENAKKIVSFSIENGVLL